MRRRRARRKRILAYGGGVVVAAGMIGFAAHQYFNRAGVTARLQLSAVRARPYAEINKYGDSHVGTSRQKR